MTERKRARLVLAQQAGQLRDEVDLGLATDLIWGSLRARWMDRTGPLTHEVADGIVEVVLDGLRPDDPKRAAPRS